jgi:hypothetical protein
MEGPADNSVEDEGGGLLTRLTAWAELSDLTKGEVRKEDLGLADQ